MRADDSLSPGDHVERATRLTQRKDILQSETLPGLPPPSDPLWLKDQQSEGLAPPPVPKIPAHVQRKRRGVHTTKKKEAIEARLSQQDWHDVYSEFQFSGLSSHISKELEMPVERVEHLLNEGIARLGLPGIRDHAINDAEVIKRVEALKAHNRNLTENNFELREPDIQKAITDRAAQEAMGAQIALDTAIKTSNIINQYATACLLSLKAGTSGFVLPEKMDPEFIKDLTNAVSTSVRATSGAVKASRLAAGETTDNIMVGIMHLIAGIPEDELRKCAELGILPPSVRGHLARPVLDVTSIQDKED